MISLMPWKAQQQCKRAMMASLLLSCMLPLHCLDAAAPSSRSLVCSPAPEDCLLEVS